VLVFEPSICNCECNTYQHSLNQEDKRRTSLCGYEYNGCSHVPRRMEVPMAHHLARDWVRLMEVTMAVGYWKT